MSISEIAALAVIAIAFMVWMLVRARSRVRAQTRLDLLRSVADPARGVPLVHEADVGHDPSA